MNEEIIFNGNMTKVTVKEFNSFVAFAKKFNKNTDITVMITQFHIDSDFERPRKIKKLKLI